jgi:hypothetical protein
MLEWPAVPRGAERFFLEESHSLRSCRRCRGSRHPIAARLRQSMQCVYCSGTQPDHNIPRTDQCEGLLLFDSSMDNGTQDLWIESGVTGQLVGVYLIALPIAVRNRPQFPDVGHNNFMAKLPELLADPDRVRSSLHRHARLRYIFKPLLDGLGCCSETASIDYFAVFVEGAVMAPDISKVNADRQLDHGMPA